MKGLMSEKNAIRELKRRGDHCYECSSCGYQMFKKTKPARCAECRGHKIKKVW